MKIKKITTTDENIEIVGATLLSVEEAEKLPLRLRGYNNWWWLRSPGYYNYNAASVYIGGCVSENGSTVYNVTGLVRPALTIKNLEPSNFKVGDRFIFGGKEFEMISDNMAFCSDDIGYSCFRRDWYVDGANDYEKSDIKKFVDNWFEKVKQEGIK